MNIIGESDILLSLGLEYQPVVDAFEQINKASADAFNQGALDAFSNKLTMAVSQILEASKALEVLNAQSKNVMGATVQDLPLQRQVAETKEAIAAINELRAAEAARAAELKAISTSPGEALAASKINSMNSYEQLLANQQRQYNSLQAEQDRKVRASQAEQNANIQYMDRMAKRYPDGSYSLSQRHQDQARLRDISGEINAGGGAAQFAAMQPDRFNKLNEEAKTLNERVRTQMTDWQKTVSTFGQHIVQWGAYAVALTAAFEIISKISQTFQDSIKYAAEFQSQSVNFTRMQEIGKSAGIPYQAGGTGELLSDSIALAQKYGDNINDVSEDMALWYKQTGSLNNALFMTNEAMKVQLATGLDLEDFYRGFTAIAFQAQDVKLDSHSKQNFNLGESPKLANMMYGAAMYGGAGMATQHENDAAGITETSNAFGILLKASEQDVASLGKLGLNMKEIIAINQGLILSMGNFGQNADNVSERLSRLTAGFAELAKLSNSTSLEKNLDKQQPGAFAGFQQVMSTQGSPKFLENLKKYMDELKPSAQKVLETTIANQRGYETINNLLKVMGGSMKDIEKAESDQNALEKTVAEMQGTYNTEVDKTKAKWQAVVMVLGMEMLPMIQNIIGAMGGMFTGLFENIGRARAFARGASSPEFSFNPKHFGFQPTAAEQLSTRLFQSAIRQRLLTPHLEKVMTNTRGDYSGTLEQLAKEGILPKLVPANDPVLNDPSTIAGNVSRATSKIDSTAKTLFFNNELAKQVMSRTGEGAQGGEIVPSPDPKGGSKGLGPDQAKIDQISLAGARFKEHNAEIQRQIGLEEALISVDEASASKKGMQVDTMNRLNVEYERYINLLKTQQGLDKTEVTHYQHVVNNFADAARKTKDPKQKARDLLDEADAQGKLTEAENQYYSHKAKIVEIQGKQSQLPFQHDEFESDSIRRQYALKTDYYNDMYSSPDLLQRRSAISGLNSIAGPQINALKRNISDLQKDNTPDNNQKIIDDYREIFSLQKDITDKTKDYNEAVKSVAKNMGDIATSLQSKTLEAALPFSGLTKGAQEQLTAQLEVRKESFDFAEQIQKLEMQGVPPDKIAQLQSMETNWQNIYLAAAAYKAKLDQIQSLPAYATMSNLIKGIGNYQSTESIMGINGPVQIENSAINQTLGITAGQQYLQVLQNQASALTNQKDILSYIYNSQITHTQEQKEAYDLENLELENQIKNLQTIEQTKQYALQHPSEAVQLAQSTYKEFTTSILNSGTTSVMGLLGGGNSQQQFTQAVANFNSTTGIAAQLSQAITQYFSPAATQLANSLKESSGGANSTNTSNINVANQGDYNYNAQVQVTGSINGVNQSGQSAFMSAVGAYGAEGLASGVGGAFNALGMNSTTNVSPSSSSFRGTATGLPTSLTNYGGLGGSTAYGGGAMFSSSTTSSSDSGAMGWGDLGPWGLNPSPNAPNAPNIGPMGNIGFGGHAPQGFMGWASMAGSAYGLFEDVTQGPGGLSGGITGAEEGMQIGSAFGPWGAPIGAGIGFLAGFLGGNHDNPADMPDKYDTQRFTLYVGELQGAAGTAYGPPFNSASDPVIQALGGKSMLQYIQSWIVANLNSPDPVKKKLATQLKPLYGTTGGGLGFSTDLANEWVKGGSLSGTYVSIYQSAMQAVQEIMKLAGDTAQPNQLVGLNSYGGGGFMAYSWNTPGYDAPFTPPGQGGGTPPSQNVNGIGGVGGGGGSPGFMGGPSSPGAGGGGASYAYTIPSAGGAGASVNATHNIGINIDGREVARTVQAYQYRTAAMGYDAIL